jgi:hypothetical protein
MVDLWKPGTGPMDYIIVRKFLDKLRDSKFLKNECVAWNQLAYTLYF